VHEPAPQREGIDAVVVGGGLAGLTTTIQLLDRGASVVLLEKERFFGGNSAWASSGINGIDLEAPSPGDSIEAYQHDMAKASGFKASTLIDVFVKNSGQALHWLRTRCNLSLTEVGQLGGHSFPRTYRPQEGLAGATIMIALSRIIQKGDWGSRLSIIKQAVATRILSTDGIVTGLEYTKDGVLHTVSAPNVVLATGGYAHDLTNTSLIQQFNPSLVGYATTNGRWATGDGHKIAMALGADHVDMANVQVHPTGFVDPASPNDPIKPLCAEILRGVGGILLNKEGNRFCNELGTRDYVVQMMNRQSQNQSFTLLLNSKAAQNANIHVPMYLRKELLRNISTMDQLAATLHVPALTLQQTFTQYNQAAEATRDDWGKSVFNNLPIDQSPYYIGTVTPVLHYCMGGLKIDSSGAVLHVNGSTFKGLYAAGEIIGGLHGNTRLGGNALTECVVFGRIVADSIPLHTIEPAPSQPKPIHTDTDQSKPTQLRLITKAELQRHNDKQDCWIAIDGFVYDFTDFLEDHPGGPEFLLKVAGADGSRAFFNVHTLPLLDDFEAIGQLVD